MEQTAHIAFGIALAPFAYGIICIALMFLLYILSKATDSVLGLLFGLVFGVFGIMGYLASTTPDKETIEAETANKTTVSQVTTTSEKIQTITEPKKEKESIHVTYYKLQGELI